MIALTGLQDVARKRAGGFSLGMGQRLGIASALLGDPANLVLDEPVNGLDPEGVLWMRDLLRAAGRRGADGAALEPPDERDGADRRPPDRHRPRPADRRRLRRGADRATRERVRLRTPDAGALAALLGGERQPPRERRPARGDRASTSDAIGELAHRHGLALHELTPVRASLEEAFMELTRDEVEYRAVAA